MRLLDRAQQLPDLSLHLLDPARGTVEQLARVETPGLGDLEDAQVNLGAEAGMDGVAPAHPHGRPGAGELLDLGQLLPDHARDSARAVAQLQSQVGAAVASLPALGLAHQEHLVDLHTVAQLVQEHGLKVKAAADGIICRVPAYRP